jgi:hydroxyacylglutathione hydrolase
MFIPLEDTAADVLSKAARGRGLSPAQLAAQTGLPEDLVKATLEKVTDSEPAAKLAPVLSLGAKQLVALAEGRYQAAPVPEVDGLLAYNTPFDDMTVNSFLVWDPETGDAAAFDTGTDCSDLLDALRDRNLHLRTIFLTHSHGDHILELDRLREKTKAPAWIGSREPVDGAAPFEAGRSFQIGNLLVQTLLTWGHSPGGITYVVKGLARPLAMVGDALFAGSMGGGNISYADALATTGGQILSLPEETIVCPGHGPLTTVGEQRLANPFFP